MSGSWPTKHSEPTVPPPKVAVLIALHVNDALSVPGRVLLYDALSARSYDNTGQLTSVSGTLASQSYSATYNYDANGNQTSSSTDIGGTVTTATYTTATGNEMTSDGTYTYTYDKNGNTLTKTNIAMGDEWFYTWNYNNQMTAAVEKTSGGVVENDETYTYGVLPASVHESSRLIC